MKLELGQVVDRYTIDRVLGAGGTAMVYLVRHNRLGTFHALKVLTLTGQSIRDRMEREGQVQAKLNHLNVVAVTDQIDIDGALGLLMEFIDGPSLEAALQRYRLTMGDAETLFAGVLAGVRAAHREGLVHRDLKPANVLLARTADGFVPKVTDFGLAKVLEQDSKVANTRSGIAMGTPSYMAPEQIRDARSVDQRADLWSLGCILYELTTRKRAFPGDEALAIYNAVVDGDFIPPRRLVEDVPDRVEQAILGCLQVDPAARIPTCDSLSAVLGGMVQWARPEDPVTTDFTIPRLPGPDPMEARVESRAIVPVQVELPDVRPIVRKRKGPIASGDLFPAVPVVSAADAPTMSVASRGPGGATPEPAPPRDDGRTPMLTDELVPHPLQYGSHPGAAGHHHGIEALAIPAGFGFDTTEDQETVLTGARAIDGTLSPLESFDRPARAGLLGFLGGGLLAVGLFGIGIGAIIVVIVLLVGSVILSNEESQGINRTIAPDPPQAAQSDPGVAPAPAEIGHTKVAPGTPPAHGPPPPDPIPPPSPVVRVPAVAAPEPAPAAVAPAPAAVAPAPAAVVAPAPATTAPMPASVPEPAPAPAPAAPRPMPAAPQPGPAPAPAPAPAPSAASTGPTRDVTFLSMPRGAQFSVNGAPFGISAQTLPLPLGNYTVRVSLAGYPTEEFAVDVTADGPTKWCYNFLARNGGERLVLGPCQP